MSTNINLQEAKGVSLRKLRMKTITLYQNYLLLYTDLMLSLNVICSQL